MTNILKPKIYFIKDAEDITRRDRQTLRRWWERNNFPKPTMISGRLAWNAQIIENWISQNIKGEQCTVNSEEAK